MGSFISGTIFNSFSRKIFIQRQQQQQHSSSSRLLPLLLILARIYTVQCTMYNYMFSVLLTSTFMRSAALNKRLQLYTCFLTLRKSKHTSSKLISIFIIQILHNIQTHILSNIPFCSHPIFELLLFFSDSLYLLFESLHDGQPSVTLLKYFFSTIVHTITKYVIPTRSLRSVLHFSQLLTPREPSRDSNLDVPNRKQAHYHLSYAAPYLRYTAPSVSQLHIVGLNSVLDYRAAPSLTEINRAIPVAHPTDLHRTLTELDSTLTELHSTLTKLHRTLAELRAIILFLA